MEKASEGLSGWSGASAAGFADKVDSLLESLCNGTMDQKIESLNDLQVFLSTQIMGADATEFSGVFEKLKTVLGGHVVQGDSAHLIASHVVQILSKDLPSLMFDSPPNHQVPADTHEIILNLDLREEVLQY